MILFTGFFEMPFQHFNIFQGGTFYNREKLNETGKKVYDLLKHFRTNSTYNRVTFPFLFKMTSIVVTSLNESRERPSVSHQANKAIDICVLPAYLNVNVFNFIHQFFPFNVYISSHNRHLHIDSLYTRPATDGSGTVPWRNNKMIEFKQKTRNARGQEVVSITTRRPNLYYFTDMIPALNNEYNENLYNRYYTEYIPVNEKPSFIQDFHYGGGVGLMTRGEVGRMMYLARFSFEQYVGEDQKATYMLPEDLQPEPNPLPWKYVIYGIVGLAGLSLITQKESSSNTYIKIGN